MPRCWFNLLGGGPPPDFSTKAIVRRARFLVGAGVTVEVVTTVTGTAPSSARSKKTMQKIDFGLFGVDTSIVLE